MYASLSAAKLRLSQRAEELLSDHVGMMAPIVVDDVFLLVAAAGPQCEQQMLAEFCVHLRKLLPPEVDAESLIDSLRVRYAQD